jgi:hypothetical protein
MIADKITKPLAKVAFKQFKEQVRLVNGCGNNSSQDTS